MARISRLWRRSSADGEKPQRRGAPRILPGEALMIVLLTVLTLAEITRPPAAAVRVSVPSEKLSNLSEATEIPARNP